MGRSADATRRSSTAQVATLVLAATALLWRATPSASADGSITPAVIDFGSQEQGTKSDSRPIEFTNTGPNPFSVTGGRVNSGPDNTDFVVAKDGCTGVTLVPGASCAVELAFMPHGVGPTSQTFGFDVSGADYRTISERAAVMTLGGTGTPAPPKPRPTAPLPTGMFIPVAGVATLGLGMLILSMTRRARPG